MYHPNGVTLDSGGNLYVSTDNRIRMVNASTGVITTFVGTGRNRSQGDGGAAVEAALAEPVGVAFDSGGNLFIVENGSGRVRRVDAATGIITTVAGGGIGDPLNKIFGDGGPATEALIKLPDDVAVDAEGNLYITTDNRIRKVDVATGVITTFAGTGERGLEGDGGPATGAGLAEPRSVEVDAAGNIFIADQENHRVRKVDGATGIMTTVAGIGTHYERTPYAYMGSASALSQSSPEYDTSRTPATGAGYSGDGGPAIEAMLSMPSSVAVDRQGNLFIADAGVRVRRVDASTGVITTVAASETIGSYETGKVQVLTTVLGNIVSIAVNGEGELFLADFKNNLVHMAASP